MGKEELEKEANDWVKANTKVESCPPWGDVKITPSGNQGYIAGAEPREKRISELEAQIEKMKCCENCQTVRDAEGNCYLLKDGKCKNKDKWELRR